jgi:hypothetical protein
MRQYTLKVKIRLLWILSETVLIEEAMEILTIKLRKLY